MMRSEQSRIDSIIAAIRGGKSGVEVAREYGVSPARISKIWLRETGIRRTRAVRAVCAVCGAPGRWLDKNHIQTAFHRDAAQQRVIARFWARARRGDDECWEWTGFRKPSGYGDCRLFGLNGPHRVAYFLAKGPIPAGLSIDHLCRNRGCVNPAHLEAVTQRENVLRSPVSLPAINVVKTHCPKGHAYTGANVLTYHGSRSCRTCATERRRLRRNQLRSVNDRLFGEGAWAG